MSVAARAKTIPLAASHVQTCLSRAHALRDGVTTRHADIVGALAELLCLEVGIDEAESYRIGQAATLHDIGKFTLPSDLLHKPGRLASEEWALVRRHSAIGHQVLLIEQDEFLNLAASIALFHHERFDGTGYPEGRSGDAIPFEARIVSVVDVYEALRADRPYKAGLDHDAAVKAILLGDERSKPKAFCPKVLAAFGRIEVQLDSAYRVLSAARPDVL